MRVKLFTAPGMPQGLALVRAELGSDAVILSTRRIRGGVEITAGIEVGEVDLPAADRSKDRAAASTSAQNLLRDHGTPEILASRLAAGPMPFALSVVFRFHPIDTKALARPLLFVGPPGGGKTLTVVRLATRLVVSGRRPRVVTADGRKAAAFEQLAAYTGILGLELERGLADIENGAAPTLIDSAGLDPFSPRDREEMCQLVRRTRALPILVLPGGIDAGEASEVASAFAECGAERLIATRLDVARRLGGILAAAAALPLAEAGISPNAAEGLVPMTPALLASYLHRRIMKNCKGSH